MISLQQFRVLLAVREHGSLTKAAEALHYGVPTLTHHLQGLEAHLGAKLVESDRNGTRLTPIGAFFAEQVAPILTKLERAERDVAELKDAGLAMLRIGTFASVGSRLLPDAIAAIQERSRVRIAVIEAEPTDVVRMLRADEIDAGLIFDATADPAFTAPDLVLETVLSEPYQVMVAKGSEWAARERVDFSDLADASWLQSRSGDEASDRVLRRVCHGAGYPVRELIRTDDLYMIHGLVERGLALALSTTVMTDTDFEVVLRPAVQDLGERRVYLASRREARPAAVDWLAEAVRAAALARAEASR
ncbi:LysR family transcriptional regulator [Microbacterium sp. NPDC056052]|uniref:LysR family transcriptional regulator n=1 Tax=Microbacterium sp. NPDC056052 TaxID=3345695 RepID=UPI0035D9CB9B